jgi:hypothetical protein
MSPLRRASAAIVLGVQGFQAEQFEAALPPDRRVSAYAFINQRNILYSLEVFRLNTSVFYRDSVDPHIYLNFPMGHEQLMHWADEVELASGGAYLIAPFGPKPMVVSAWASLNRLRYRMRSATSPVNALTDVVLPGSHHYGSPYSLGRGSVCVFSMQLGKVGRGG